MPKLPGETEAILLWIKQVLGRRRNLEAFLEETALNWTVKAAWRLCGACRGLRKAKRPMVGDDGLSLGRAWGCRAGQGGWPESGPWAPGEGGVCRAATPEDAATVSWSR